MASLLTGPRPASFFRGPGAGSIPPPDIIDKVDTVDIWG